jgi:hypothetical protein
MTETMTISSPPPPAQIPEPTTSPAAESEPQPHPTLWTQADVSFDYDPYYLLATVRVGARDRLTNALRVAHIPGLSGGPKQNLAAFYTVGQASARDAALRHTRARVGALSAVRHYRHLQDEFARMQVQVASLGLDSQIIRLQAQQQQLIAARGGNLVSQLAATERQLADVAAQRQQHQDDLDTASRVLAEVQATALAAAIAAASVAVQEEQQQLVKDRKALMGTIMEVLGPLLDRVWGVDGGLDALDQIKTDEKQMLVMIESLPDSPEATPEPPPPVEPESVEQPPAEDPSSDEAVALAVGSRRKRGRS